MTPLTATYDCRLLESDWSLLFKLCPPWQGNLALFIRDMKKDNLIPIALQSLRRAHYLASLVCGPHHPDAPNTLVIFPLI